MSDPKKMISCKKCGAAILSGNFCIDCLSKEEMPKLVPPKSPPSLPRDRSHLVPPPPPIYSPIPTSDYIRRAKFKRDNPDVMKFFDNLVEDLFRRIEELPSNEERFHFLKGLKRYSDDDDDY